MIEVPGANVYCRKRVPEGVATLTPDGGRALNSGSAVRPPAGSGVAGSPGRPGLSACRPVAWDIALVHGGAPPSKSK